MSKQGLWSMLALIPALPVLCSQCSPPPRPQMQSLDCPFVLTSSPWIAKWHKNLNFGLESIPEFKFKFHILYYFSVPSIVSSDKKAKQSVRKCLTLAAKGREKQRMRASMPRNPYLLTAVFGFCRLNQLFLYGVDVPKHRSMFPHSIWAS